MAHDDAEQNDVACARVQTLLQLPQLLWSFVVLTHCCPASPLVAHTDGSVVGHEQELFAQVAPLAQTTPQSPQLLMSLVTSTQTPEHILSVLWQGMHDLFEHRYDAGQAFPQPPQLAWSVARSTQAPLQGVDCAAGHLHAPAMHIAPLAHATPQEPQWAGSVCVSTHWPAPQSVVGHS
jgi:hypothetical protein